MSGPHDLFICHDSTSAGAVKRLTAALAARGTACCAFEAGQRTELQPKLATSKACLIWATEALFHSRGAQMHLAMAQIARQQEAPAKPERLLIVNAEPGVKHIYPVFLRERLIGAAPGLPDAPDLATLAGWLHERCATLKGSLGELYPAVQGGWLEPYDRLSQAPEHFAGRCRELWDIHTALMPPADVIAQTGKPPAALVVISAASDQGKSSLSREYAFRFGAAYPGGVYRLSAAAARPAIRLAELAQNPPLKHQLHGLLRQLEPDSPLNDASSLAALSARLGARLGAAGQPYLWLVDDVPDGINGPVLQQWLAPDPTGQLGRNLIMTRSPRYDHRGEPVHLPILDETTGAATLSHGRAPARGDEYDAALWLLDELGRQPRYAAMAAALAEQQRPHRRAIFGWLLRKLEKPHRHTATLTTAWPQAWPKDNAARCATLLLNTLGVLEGPARDLLRLAGVLSAHDLPLDFAANCLALGGLSADDHREDPFTILLNEPQEEPLTPATAREYVEQGAASLAAHALAERTDQGIRLYHLAVAALTQVVPASPRQSLLREGALQALYVIAENSQTTQDWRPLAALAPHGRKLIEDLRDRLIESEDSPAEITGRIRLAMYLADLDLRHGENARALVTYRAASAYLVRAMAIDPQNGSRQRDFARVQEQLGDLLLAKGDAATALDHYRKSLGIRSFLAKQEAQRLASLKDPLRLHGKIGQIQQQQNDLAGALQSQQAAHALLGKLALLSPGEPDPRFDLAASHARLAELHISLHQAAAAMTELELALPVFTRLAELHPDTVRFVRAPVAIHNRIGDLLCAQDDLSGALNRYRMAQAIAGYAAQLEPGNPEAQRDVAVCHNHIGDTLMSLDDQAEANEHYEAFLAIAKHPANAEAFAGLRRRDIAAVHIKLGRSLETAKDIATALEHYQYARRVIEKLAIGFTDNLRLRDDLVWLRNKIDRLKDRQEAELRRQQRQESIVRQP